MKYRSEIDGLRAIAVIPVILFHAGFELFKGGFVGVDVFFVISGYLITTILIEDIEKKRFTIIGFYERRARRILPALFFVSMLCVLFAWLWMFRSQFIDFSESLIAISIFASNILFYMQSGYFAEAAEVKPLLHTWSLAVEEQFYLLFPILLLLIWKLGKSTVFWIIFSIFLVSLAIAEWGWRNAPSANFYLAPSRAWELLAGSIVAFAVRSGGVRSSNFISSLGFLLIVFSIVLFDKTIPFPSIYALLPVSGAMMIILYAKEDTLVAKFLSGKVLVGAGLISYSSYLWHQPLFAFLRIRVYEHPNGLTMFLVSLMSLFFGYLSWRFIEKPFRGSESISRVAIFSVSFVGILIFIFIGVMGVTGKFTPKSDVDIEKFTGWKDKHECFVGFWDNSLDRKELVENCFGESNNYFLLGDSHADSMSSSLRKAMDQKNYNLISLIDVGCLPIVGTSRLPLQDSCVKSKKIYWDIIKSSNATVIISARWRLNLIGPRFDNQEGGVEYGSNGQNFVIDDKNADIIDYSESFLHKMSHKNDIVLLTQIPEAGWDVPLKLAKLKRFGSIDPAINLSTSHEVYLSQNGEILSFFQRLASNENISVIKAEDVVCDKSSNGRCLNSLGGAALYRDDDHPSPLLSSMLVEKIMSHIIVNK